jgi:hypothetical protein
LWRRVFSDFPVVCEHGQLVAQHEELEIFANSLRRPLTGYRSTAEKARWAKERSMNSMLRSPAAEGVKSET